MIQELRTQIEACLQQLPSDAGGGCPVEKALLMAEYIVSEEITYAVEIGVYKGRSFFPQALAQKHIGGIIIGVDPYLKESAREKDLSPVLKVMVDNLIDSWDTFESYVSNLGTIINLKVGNNALIIRETSEVAVKYLPGEIGLLHIDGNHDVEFVEKDINLYLPKIKKNGLIIMDDTDWESVRSCLHLLNDSCLLEKDYGLWQVWRKR